MLDGGRALIGMETVAIGDGNTVVTTIRDVYRAALLKNADHIVLAHNHIDGDVAPSVSDRDLTRGMRRAGELLCINLIDHVIVGPCRDHFSFYDAGFFDPISKRRRGRRRR